MPPRQKTLWNWTDDSGALKPYFAADDKILEATFTSSGGAGKAKATLNGSPYEFDFDAMVQKNLESGRVRKIARSADAPAVGATPKPTIVPGGKWYWADDSNAMKTYYPKDEAILEKVYMESNGAGKAKATLNGSPYEFDFDAMAQKNLESGRVRKIERRVPEVPKATEVAVKPTATTLEKEEKEEKVSWAWLDDSGNGKPFLAEFQPKLEKAYQVGAGTGWTEIDVKGTVYRVDFASMTQTNTTTKGTRNLRRLVGGVDTATPKSAAKPKSVEKRDREDEDAVGSKSAAKSIKVTNSDGTSTKVLKKGRGVVDVHSGLSAKAHVYEEGPDVYQCTLNQTNIAMNNNKFYIIQLLEDDSTAKYWVWTRWARVGQVGQSKLDSYPTLSGAKAGFCSKFRDKTSNDWGNRANFTKIAGKYHLMEIDYGDDEEEDAPKSPKKGPIPTSALPPALQRLMKKISDKLDMEKTMKEMEIDTRKMPLGKISKKQIKDAFGYLKTIEKEIEKSKPNRSAIVDASSMFYTLIPHDFGMMVPPPIFDPALLKRKMDLLDMLSDLEIASKLLEESKSSGKNPLDAAYDSMRCKLEPVDHGSDVYKRICDYVSNTHGKTHTAYTLSVQDVFEVDRAGEKAAYESSFGSLHNKQMLWHGSRATNFMGILSQGLRIAPPEAPVTGYMFGKGVYFADVSSKSANYCHTSRTNNEGVLLLCEVALGNEFELTEAKYMDHAPKGCHSTKGVGKMHPDPSGATTSGGVTWPLGKTVDNKAVKSTALLYNEFIVYDVKQLQMKYLITIKFNYK
eukprot:PhM_4_TR18750/c1_g1_i2/m.55584/K10798/PARP; poly [ADP-ribose] polymerase